MKADCSVAFARYLAERFDMLAAGLFSLVSILSLAFHHPFRLPKWI
jgi:hypothetical protein